MQVESVCYQPAVTYVSAKCQQTGECSMDFTFFFQFSQVVILKSGKVVFISTPGEMNMGLDDQAVCF